MIFEKKPEFIIAIGASAGGLNAVTELISQIPEDINAAVFVVLHMSKVGVGSFLIHRLQKYTNYRCSLPEDGEKIEAGHIYLAPPDEHLLVANGAVVIGRGPAENRWRPSIDVLFRSAAANYGSRAIGIILTGYLNDGTSGMAAIKKSGGHCIVQDPNEAEYPDMPLSVIENMEVDYCVKLADIGAIIRKISNKEVNDSNTVPPEVIREAEIAQNVATGMEVVSQVAERSVFSCPDCGGGLWGVKEDVISRYRCAIGHAYSEEDLSIKQSESIEATLWVALRMMEERKSLLKKISGDQSAKGFARMSDSHKERAADLEKHIDKLKELLFSAQKATG
ncbi:MAG: hypothetical protein JWQ96_667 [Segetibacter sp.]|nr:hypothetical protein [Segetibacter sp.]